MKKIFNLSVLTLLATGANAQAASYVISDKRTFEEFVRNIVILLMLVIVTSFILRMIKLFLDSRLKIKMVEADTPETVLAQLINQDKDDSKKSLKWFCALLGIAAGLGIIGCFQLSDIYAMTVIAFCLALGFLTHYFLLNRLSKK